MVKVFSLLFFLILFIPFQKVNALEQINSFDVDIVAHKDGVMSITEDIKYDFGDGDRHGIFRTIPLVSKIGDLYRVIGIDFTGIERDGRKEPFKIDQSAKQTEVKIGDPDRTINGVHDYVIKYDVKNGVGSNYADHDEIYWNVTGNQWSIPIGFASARISTDFGTTQTKVACFSRPGNLDAQFCNFEKNPPFNPIKTTKTLDPGEGLTVVASFPINTFPKSELRKDEPFIDPDFLTFLKILIPIYFSLNFIVAPLIIYLFIKRKNKSRLGKVTVNFDMPEYPKGMRISPAEAGTIDNAKLDKDDIVATILDLAIRKFIKIEEVKQKGKFLGIGSSSDYKLTKLKEFSNLNDFEKSLMDKILGSDKSALLKDSKLTFTDFTSLEKQNFETLIKRKFYTKNPKTQMSVLLTFGIIATLTLNFAFGPVLIYLSRKLNGRTLLGDEIDWKTDGLKLFLKNMSREYKWQAENFFFVEKMIPYAASLGFLDQYMEQLKILKPEYKPTWYSGSGNFYNSYYFFGSSFSSNITTTAPSSSSGFSGGSSGGGGGGGGGGSW